MIGQDLDGKPRTNFHYFDKGDMATIGRKHAVAKVEWPFKAHWGGIPAWATWLVVHIFFLIGFRNRVSVLLEWAYTYFTFTRGARLITGDHTLVGWNAQEGVAPESRPSGDDGVAVNVVGNPRDVSHLPERTVAATKQPV
jgi:NADH:ubiquinone reductase (H+-translocating)